MSGNDPIDLTPVSPQVSELLDRAESAPDYGTVETYQPGESTENTLYTPVTSGGNYGTSEAVEDLTYGSSEFPGEPTEV